MEIKKTVEVVKGTAKKFWEENKTAIIMVGCFICGYKLGNKISTAQVEVGLQTIARVTPELTMGNFTSQCLKGTFDLKNYI